MTTSSKRIAIVTGAGMGSGGLGRGIAAQLASENISLMIADADPRVAEVAAHVSGMHPGIVVESYAGDLSCESNVKEMVDRTIDKFGRIDILVNNAGGGVIKPFLEHDNESLTTTLARNLWTAIWCSHKTLPHMVSQNHGRIINIGADSLRTGIPAHAGYNAAKGGVVGMMVGLAKEFAHYDITINTVSPCVINTERHRANLNNINKARTAAFIDVVPKGRSVEIGEIADMVCFLARPQSGFITGQEFSVNGGSAMP